MINYKMHHNQTKVSLTMLNVKTTRVLMKYISTNELKKKT